jgi:hypothetical protein
MDRFATVCFILHPIFLSSWPRLLFPVFPFVVLLPLAQQFLVLPFAVSSFYPRGRSIIVIVVAFINYPCLNSVAYYGLMSTFEVSSQISSSSSSASFVNREFGM